MIEQLKEQIKVVVRARAKAQEAIEAKNASYTEWENNNQMLLDAMADTSQLRGDAETALRELTLQAYAQTGNKTPVLGVGIREVTKLEYDTQVAFNWAIEHTMALRLDTSAFEKIAKVSPPDFVKVFQEPQATIATQLEIEL